MKLLIAGDSFAAKYPGEFPGWADLMEDHYVVENIAQCGVGEYKILKQIESVNLKDYDVVIISHTSPYRIHTAMNPLHTDGIHNSCDFIYEDVRGRLPDVEKFFTEYFDLEYATRIHGLLHKEIDKILKNSFVIDTKLLGIEKLFKTNRGTVQHLDKAGNQKFFFKLQKILDKHKQKEAV